MGIFTLENAITFTVFFIWGFYCFKKGLDFAARGQDEILSDKFGEQFDIAVGAIVKAGRFSWMGHVYEINKTGE